MSTPSQLTVVFVNNSGVHDSDVYIGFVPGAGTTTTILNLGNGQSLEPVNASAGSGIWYTLNTLKSGIGITSFSGRIYACYGTPWQVVYAGYEPAQSVVDPNLFLRYDKMEITFTGQPADVANLTSIDYWSIPMTLIALQSGTQVGIARALLPGVTTQDIFDTLNALTTPPASGLAGPGGIDGTPLPALVPGQYQQYPGGPAPGTTFARIIGPSSYPPPFPAPGAIPVTPYDLLEDYLTYLLDTFGPGTKVGAVVAGLGDGTIANIAGNFAGVGSNPPPNSPLSPQSYSLTAAIDSDLNLKLTGSTSVMGTTTMRYEKDDLLNPTGIYGGNAPYYLNGSSTSTAPQNDVYGWIGGDLFSGLNIGAVGSSTVVNGSVVGAIDSQQWFTLPLSSFFSNLQPGSPPHLNYNQWAASLTNLSDAYNFAYSDRFAPVLVSLNPANVDRLEIRLSDATVNMG